MSEEATIRRGARNARYTTLPNQVLEDVRLSMEARWLLSYLLSKPDNWIVRVADISKKGGCGRDKARRMVNELVEFGYAEKEQNRGEEGKFGRLSLVVYDEPREAGGSIDQEENGSVAFLPQTENPSTAEPSTANASLVKTDVIATPDSNLEREARASADGQASEPGGGEVGGAGARRDDPRKFEARVKRLASRFDWPRWSRSSTDWAVRNFAALTDAERAEAEAFAQAYIGHCGKGALSIGVYFGEKKWRDLPAQALAAVDPAARPQLAAPFGKLWGAKRMALLIGSPPQPSPQASGFLAAQLADPGEAGQRVRLERQARFGWPGVNRMDELAAQAKPWPIAAFEAAQLERLAEATEQVWTGTPLWDAWRDEFARRGWPWLPEMGRQRVASFPAGGLEGLEAFERAVRDGVGTVAQARKAG